MPFYRLILRVPDDFLESQYFSMNFEGLFWLQHQSILGSHTVRNQVTGCYYDISNQPTHPKKAEDLYVRDPALF